MVSWSQSPESSLGGFKGSRMFGGLSVSCYRLYSYIWDVCTHGTPRVMGRFIRFRMVVDGVWTENRFMEMAFRFGFMEKLEGGQFSF